MTKDFKELREQMVGTQVKARGVKDARVLDVMKKVPRHEFVPENMRPYAYNDEPLPIGEGQTISQPYIVAYMTEALRLDETQKVLEIGTGSGYQSAILAEIVREVYTVEIVEYLSLRAQEVLRRLGYHNICFKVGDGSLGWQEHAPYDSIIATAAPARVPEALQKQLKVGGRMIIPIGENFQELVLVIKGKKKFKKKNLLPVRFVPLITVH